MRQGLASTEGTVSFVYYWSNFVTMYYIE